MIGGEELHNNHHAYVTSAKFSSKWWEFDIGWLYIRILAILRLAVIRRVAPKVRFKPIQTRCDVETLQAIIIHRYDVLAKFAKYVKRTVIAEVRNPRSRASSGLKDTSTLDAVRHSLQRDAVELPQKEQTALKQALESSEVLRTIYSMRRELAVLWSRSTASKEQLLKQLEDWCWRAEDSGIFALEAFSRKLRRYG